MGYSKDHSKNECDKCLADVGRENLIRVPFLFCDKNDKMHPDRSRLVGRPLGSGYRQYKVCKICYDKEMKRAGQYNEKMNQRNKKLYGENGEWIYR